MNELEATIETRHGQLVKLLELTARQSVAITQGPMSELLPVLAEKSRLTTSFVTLSQQLKRHIESSSSPPEISTRHRVQHEQCNVMHRELMARETACEASLADVRGRLGETLTGWDSARLDGTRVDGTRVDREPGIRTRDDGAFQAAIQHARAARELLSRGDHLDLTNDG